jgi:hypothetical protein
MGNMCMRLRNAGKGEASPSLFPRFAPNTGKQGFHCILTGKIVFYLVNWTSNILPGKHGIYFCVLQGNLST